MYTTTTLASKLGVPYQTAVGLLAYLKAKNAVTTTPVASEPGKKGRKELLYHFSPDTVKALTDLIDLAVVTQVAQALPKVAQAA